MGGCCGRGWGMRFPGRGRRWFALRTMRARNRVLLRRRRRVRDGLRGMHGRGVWMRMGTRRPSDYHKVLRKRIKALEERIREARRREGLGEFEARGFVDTGPVVERALATAAGVGWTGKNTCLIHPRLGSFGFLAVLLTSLPVEDERVRRWQCRIAAGVAGGAWRLARRGR